MKGKLVICEGLDCSGKTTAIEKITDSDSKYTYSKGIGSNSWFGKIARRLPSTFMFLFELIYNIHTHILPNLKKGKIIMQDRYEISITSFVPNVNKWHNQLLIQIAKPLIVKPHAIVYFYLPLEERIKRLRQKGKKYEIILAANPDMIILREKEYEKWYNHFDGPKIKINTWSNNIAQTARILENFVNSTS
jgi:thymidylate kinase